MVNLFLGIDSSTQGCKFVVINADNSQIEYIDSVNYDSDLPQYDTKDGVIQTSEKKFSEADPNMWIDALHLLFKRMVHKNFEVNQIKAISVSGQQHGLVALDSQGDLTRKISKLWNDYSTTEECELLTKKIGGKEQMIAEIGNSQRTGYTAGKIFHLYRHEPEVAQKATTFFLVHNFVNWFLTGGKNNGVRVMEPGDTSGMALSFPGSQNWSNKVCDIISKDLTNKLPPVRPATEMIGKISSKLIIEYGFSTDCWIDAGCGDNMYGAVGTGNIKPGIVTISLGTSGTACTILDEPYVDPSGEIASYCDSTGKYMPLLCVSNMANGYNQILKQYNLSHENFTKILGETSPGNKGRILFPWYMGERTPDLPNASPVYWGFLLDDFQKPILCRAVLEGHILNLFDGYQKMPVQANEIRLTGGLSKSDAWSQTIADIFETDTVPVEGEGAALGAAIHAAWVYFKQEENNFELESLTNDFIKLDESKRKYPNNADVYRKLKAAYHEISLRLRSGVGEIDPFQMMADIK